MPIIDVISEHDYLLYQAGFKTAHPTARFEQVPADEWRLEHNHFDSSSPDPRIVKHDYHCPNHPRFTDDVKGWEYYYRLDQLPPNYVNEVRPNCIDEHNYNHAGRCPYATHALVERMFIEWLRKNGNEPLILEQWVEPSDPEQRLVTRYGCPLCEKDNQCAFGYCPHGEPFTKLTHDWKWLRDHTPQEVTAECDTSPMACGWASWSKCALNGPRYRMYTYEGCVLTTRERNGYDESDFYAIVWDEAYKCVREVEYDSTRYAGGAAASQDYTEEVVAKVYAYCCNLFAHQAYNTAVDTATRFQKGKRIVVTKSVKRAKDARNNVPKGMTGTVMQLSDSSFGARVQFVDDQADQDVPMDRWKHYHWVSAENVEVVEPEQYYISPEDAWAQGCATAWGIINQKAWKSITYVPSPGWLTVI